MGYCGGEDSCTCSVTNGTAGCTAIALAGTSGSCGIESKNLLTNSAFLSFFAIHFDWTIEF